MQKSHSQDKTTGFWIWLAQDHDFQEEHCLFRKNFLLSSLPDSAEIRISAGSFFHLYINGEHCLAGPTPGIEGHIHVSFLNVCPYLQPGENCIAVNVFHSSAPQSNQADTYSGLWCQLTADGHTLISTDASWECLNLKSYIKSGLDQYYCGTNVEILDFNQLPHNWEKQHSEKGLPEKGSSNATYSASPVPISCAEWQSPSIVIPIADLPFVLETGQDSNSTLSPLFPLSLHSSGKTCLERRILWVNFRDVAPQHQGGVFIAECYIYSWEENWFDVNCYGDRPYRLFLNEEVVLQQAPPPPPVRTVANPKRNSRLEITEFVLPTISMHFLPGWNRLFLVENCDSRGHGLTMIWEDCPADKLSVHCKPNTQSPAGWTMTGPMKSPFAMILPDMFPQLPDSIEFYLSTHPAWDISLILQANTFVEDAPGEMLCNPYQLAEHQYLIFDLKQTVFGFPRLTFDGNKGDVIDIVCGEHIDNHSVVSFEHNHRNVSTLILNGAQDTWISNLPRGFKYIMILARHVSGTVSVSIPQAQWFVSSHTCCSTFSCSDDCLNAIWETGRKTLEKTMHGGFLDSPSGEQTQFIADAMIQSWAAYHLFGAFDYCRQSIQAFASSQIETGALNSSAPSGIFQSIPDYSLLWIIWLHRHIIYTGDMEFLHNMMPAVEKLLAFFDYLAIFPDGPLSDMHDYNGLYALLDMDNSIDMTGISTGLNAIYCKALSLAAELSRLNQGRPLEAAYLQRASLIKSTTRSLTWSPEHHNFADSYYNDTPSEHHAWQSTVLGLYGGFVDADECEKVWSQLFSNTPPFIKFSSENTDNPFFNYYILDVAMSLGKQSWAASFLSYYWGKMLEAGADTWWESFSPSLRYDTPPHCCLCQGYGTSPNGFIVSCIAGIVPIEPRFSSISFLPLFSAARTLNLELPTPQGSITLSWFTADDGKLHVTLGASFPLEVCSRISNQDKIRILLTVNDYIKLNQNP